jgi:hypothetical protein
VQFDMAHLPPRVGVEPDEAVLKARVADAFAAQTTFPVGVIYDLLWSRLRGLRPVNARARVQKIWRPFGRQILRRISPTIGMNADL